LYQEPFFTLFDRKSISFEFYGKCEISQKKIFKVKNKYLTDAYVSTYNRIGVSIVKKHLKLQSGLPDFSGTTYQNGE
jgi:hypothetical protein